MGEDLERLVTVINNLSNTTLRTEKESIIKDNQNFIEFVEMCKFLYNPMIVSGLSSNKIEKPHSIYSFDIFGSKESHSFVEVLEYLKDHNTGRDVDIEFVQDYILDHIEHSELLKKIFTKELKLGIDATTINKVYGSKFIPTFDVMLAENYFENKEVVSGKNFILTLKCDGHRMCAVIELDGTVKLYTRQGQPYKNMPEIESELKKLPRGYVYDGELILDKISNDTEELFRATTSAVRKKGVKTGVVFYVFDMLKSEDFWNGYSPESASSRKSKLHSLFTDSEFKWIKEVEVLYEGNDESAIERWLDKITSEGGEGVMINLSDGPYECKRTKQLLKVKKFKTADVLVKAINSGKGKFENTLGSITIEFEHKGNRYLCDVGSGFLDSQRELYWNNRDLLLGKIVEIQYFEISQDADGDYSMRFPVWLNKIRNDKQDISMY